MTDMAAWCDHVTRNRDVLSISWSGGGDEGFIKLQLNDTPLDEEDGVPATLIDRLYDGLGYDGFSGNFSCEGEATYDPETQCFEGMDTYSISEYDSKDCAIEIRLSKDIWFDEVVIRWQAEDDEASSVWVKIVVYNGPHTEDHARAEANLANIVARAIDRLIEDIGDFAGLNGGISIPAVDFDKSGPEAIGFIREIAFSYYDRRDTTISISVTNKTPDNDSL